MSSLPPWGVYGPGMDQFVRDELELGGRVAVGLDDADTDPWTVADDLQAAERQRMLAEWDREAGQ